jgi:hypothetical protein
MVGKDGAVGLASALDGKVALSRAIVQLSGDAMVCDPSAFKGAVLQSEKLISRSCDMSRPCLRKRSNQRLAWQIMKLRPGFADGFCALAICREAITFLSRKNFGWDAWCPADERDYHCAQTSRSWNDKVHVRHRHWRFKGHRLRVLQNG